MAWTYVITINKMLKKYKDQSRYIVVYCAKIPKIFQQSMDDEIDMFSTKKKCNWKVIKNIIWKWIGHANLYLYPNKKNQLWN